MIFLSQRFFSMYFKGNLKSLLHSALKLKKKCNFCQILLFCWGYFFSSEKVICNFSPRFLSTMCVVVKRFLPQNRRKYGHAKEVFCLLKTVILCLPSQLQLHLAVVLSSFTLFRGLFRGCRETSLM